MTMSLQKAWAMWLMGVYVIGWSGGGRCDGWISNYALKINSLLQGSREDGMGVICEVTVEAEIRSTGSLNE